MISSQAFVRSIPSIEARPDLLAPPPMTRRRPNATARPEPDGELGAGAATVAAATGPTSRDAPRRPTGRGPARDPVRAQARTSSSAGSAGRRTLFRQCPETGGSLLFRRGRTEREVPAKGKFVGPLGPDIREALTEKEAWRKATDQLEAIDVETKLRGWRDEARQFFGVDLDDPINKSIDHLEEWGLKQAIPDPERDQIRKEFHDFAGTIKEQIEAEVEELVRRMEESQRILSPAELDKLVQAREELDRALPSS